MLKIISSIAGLISGYLAWQISKYMILLSGPFLLMPMGISWPRAAENLEAIANIFGFILFIIVTSKIYKLILKKNHK
jgi:hypothetical protein